MPRSFTSGLEQWPLARPFRIARGVKTVAEVVNVAIGAGNIVGRGEAVPYARYGETGASVLAQVRVVQDAVRQGVDRARLAHLLPPGAARNALDCALWDLEVKLGLQKLPPVRAIETALTVGIDEPAAMAMAAAAIAGSLIKVKVDARAPEACLRAVRTARPDARLIVDPNESWSFALLATLQPLLAELAVDFVEQPLPSNEDAALEGFVPLVPICADESCHVTADLDHLRSRYALINIKLDKTGGLTEAMAMLERARALDFGVMVGCMISTSLSIAPALQIAMHADYADLDGPWWLKQDQPGGVRFDGSRMKPPAPGFWGTLAHGAA